jgi:hypothetical protein
MRSATGSGAIDILRHMVVPVLALALPIAAMFERLQAQAVSETLAQPFVAATIARGVPQRRIVWRDDAIAIRWRRSTGSSSRRCSAVRSRLKWSRRGLDWAG